ncbi:uncharacterized protein C8Q71DRAFT_285918 [Rhodofomes roseus]|uniref:F-box domain-containing protein n=1 Tax=Rhodofomes roseus TaxID=34475 RepID=A0ABQ8K4G8_9APHY|nr:uncharacterized protein C8Q71DRAFT_285918 [Rhodofomes roseus]KAH9831806.1 hypothetical protein C8Q71DRAFT_285918 [Rhodofomes roseus]
MAKIETSPTDDEMLPEGDAQVLETAGSDSDVEASDKSESDESEIWAGQYVHYDPRLPSVRARVDIHFKASTYSSDTYPRLPHELVERICEFHRDSPLVLVSCMSVCCAWYHAARRLLERPNQDLKLRTQADLRSYANRLLSTRNTAFNKDFAVLDIYDNAREPFAHIWPILVPGSFLRNVSELTLRGVDWTTTNPHDSFDKCLSKYCSITALTLRGCSFRTRRDLRRIIDALLNLKEFALHDVILQNPGPVPSHIPARHKKLEKITLSSYRGKPISGAEVLDTCTVYSSIRRLEMGVSFFPLVSRLPQYLDHFPRLQELRVKHALEMDLLSMGDTHARPLSKLAFDEEMTEPIALQVLGLLSTHHACSTLEHLKFVLNFEPSAEFLLRLTHVLDLCGPTLKYFDWNVKAEVIPQLTANTSLQIVWITIVCNTPRLRTIQKIFDAVLSNITSSQLERLSIEIHLDNSEPLFDATTIEKTFKRAYSTPGSTSQAFHSILSRDVFDGLPAAASRYSIFQSGVKITLSFDASDDDICDLAMCGSVRRPSSYRRKG